MAQKAKGKAVAKKGAEKPAQKQTAQKREESSAETKGSGSWYSVGDEGFAKKEQLDKQAKLRKERNVKRFWMKEGTTARICFVDGSKPFFVQEHRIPIAGQKQAVLATCTQEFRGSCALCDAPGIKAPTLTGYFTVIDNRSWTDREGKVHKNEKVLYPAKGATINKLKKLIAEKGDLTGMVFDVSRESDQDPNCGRDFEFVGKTNIAAKLGADAAVPHDYKKVLAPLTAEDLRGLGFKSQTVVGSSEDVGDDVLGTDAEAAPEEAAPDADDIL